MIRTYGVRIDVLRNGAKCTALQPVIPPIIDCDSSADIKTSLYGEFYANSSVDWLNDELMPCQIIDGKEVPVGVFSAAAVKDSYDENGAKTIVVEAYDRGLRLMQTKTETIIHISAGTNYMTVIEELLVASGVSLWISDKTTKTVATDREDWPIGTSNLKIINTLLSEISFDPIWFDVNGYAVLRTAKNPSAANIDHHYGDRDKVKVLARPCSKEVDMFNTPNVFIAICENPDLESPLISTAVNDDPHSSFSVVRRGRRIAQTFKVNNIPDQEALDTFVQQLMIESVLSEETVIITTANVQNHNVRDTVALTHPDISGLFQEVSWHMSLAPGMLMQHKLRRSVFV